MSSPINALEQLLAAGRDDAVLRFSLGNAYLATDAQQAITHLERALEMDPTYSAAWKLLGKAFVNAGNIGRASEIFSEGIVVAEQKGDVQAAKEMQVFLKRLQKN